MGRDPPTLKLTVKYLGAGRTKSRSRCAVACNSNGTHDLYPCRRLRGDCSFGEAFINQRDSQSKQDTLTAQSGSSQEVYGQVHDSVLDEVLPMSKNLRSPTSSFDSTP